MSPDPYLRENKTTEDTMNSIEENNVYFDVENDNSDESSDENPDTEYAGYKLLQQDEVVPVEHINDEIDVNIDTLCQEEEVENEAVQAEDQACFKHEGEDIKIDYQNLHCIGVEDEFLPTGLGFPEVNNDEFEDMESSKSQDIPMTDSQVELVKTAMVGFKLPEMHVPVWAKQMSDDQWVSSIEKLKQT